MLIFIIILITIIAFLITVVVLAQNPKGGGVNAMMGGIANNVMGARRSSDILEKSTWILAIALFVLCLSTSFLVEHKSTDDINTENEKLLELAPTPEEGQTPVVPEEETNIITDTIPQ